MMFERLAVLATICCTYVLTFSTVFVDPWRRIAKRDEFWTEHSPVFEVTSKLAPVCEAHEWHEIDFTLVTQLSASRLFVMEEQCRRWGPHPISLALVSNLSVKAIQIALESLGCPSEFMSVHVLPPDENEKEYPVNKLRNLAFSGLKTSHAAYVDADFLVSANLYDSLLQKRRVLTNQTALVLPAFELRNLCEPQDHDCRRMHRAIIPETKEQLLELYSEPDHVAPSITQFDSKGNLEGHGSTRYQEWLSQQNNTLVPITCFTSDRYEPYLVLEYCEDMPPFQEEFTGYGKNKVTWLWHLRQAGYSFYQVGDSFLVHLPHAKSKSFQKWNHQKQESGRDSLQVEQTSKKFQEWLALAVPNQSVVGDCPHVVPPALA